MLSAASRVRDTSGKRMCLSGGGLAKKIGKSMVAEICGLSKKIKDDALEKIMGDENM